MVFFCGWHYSRTLSVCIHLIMSFVTDEWANLIRIWFPSRKWNLYTFGKKRVSETYLNQVLVQSMKSQALEFIDHGIFIAIFSNKKSHEYSWFSMTMSITGSMNAMTMSLDMIWITWESHRITMNIQWSWIPWLRIWHAYEFHE
jgi:hypothetical protein